MKQLKVVPYKNRYLHLQTIHEAYSISGLDIGLRDYTVEIIQKHSGLNVPGSIE